MSYHPHSSRIDALLDKVVGGNRSPTSAPTTRSCPSQRWHRDGFPGPLASTGRPKRSPPGARTSINPSSQIVSTYGSVRAWTRSHPPMRSRPSSWRASAREQCSMSWRPRDSPNSVFRVSCCSQTRARSTHVEKRSSRVLAGDSQTRRWWRTADASTWSFHVDLDPAHKPRELDDISAEEQLLGRTIYVAPAASYFLPMPRSSPNC